jgi:diguanylate cyclase (GGDEF)-like protein
LKALVVVVLGTGGAVAAWCLLELAGSPLPQAEIVAMLAAGMLLAELFPLRLPGRADETSFSTAFAFALLVSHGTPATAIVATGCMIAADVVRRRAAVKLSYNAAQHALSWAGAGLVYEALSGPPGGTFGPAELAALVPAGLVFGIVNGTLAALPSALIAGHRVRRHLGRDVRLVLATTAVLLTLAPIVVVVAEHALWLVPLLGPLLAAIQLASRQALLNEARARVDPLTGALSRRELEVELERRLRGADGQPAVVVLDVEGFADVNDALGYSAGDAVLITVVRRLLAAVEPGELVARSGGDAFAVLCETARAEDVVARAHAVLEAPIAVAGLEIDLHAVAGIACAPAESAETLLRQADVALRAAKERRRRWVRYEPAMSVDAAERVALAPELRRAIAADQLVLHYQPKLDLRTGELAGVEALVRWERPGHGLVPPGAFIELAEQTGLIRPLTLWVLRTAVADQVAWAADGLRVPVAVNLSARALHADIVDEVKALQDAHATLTGGLELEVTESAAMQDPAHSLAVLEQLAATGVRLSVDDFGTGHSSLAYLERLPVTALKIDRGFVAGLDGDTANRSIVTMTIELGHRLGLEVIAEGVEDDPTLGILRGLGCDLAQGFGIARPMPADAARELLLASADARAA